MKICRFFTNGEASFGLIADGEIVACDERLQPTGRIFAHNDVKILPPVQPSKIVCVGRNYTDHAKELGNEVPAEPLLFLKAPSSIIASGEPIVIPPQSERVEHEAELAIVIAKTCRNLDEAANLNDFVMGYTCLNDVTARDLQKTDVQFTRAKSFDTFCPVGPHIETDLDISEAIITCRVNKQVRQNGHTRQMVFSISELIVYISRQMTLLAGDLIATGTPSGVSQLKAGDVCEVEIKGIGILANPIL